MSKDLKKRLSAIALILVLILSVCLSGCKAEEVEEEEVIPPPPPSNPLTGELVEDGFDESALNRRIAAFVVENTPDARPQWGLVDEKYSPDVVLMGEVEGGITRTLWMYADYNKLPEVIGPMRSARPPYIRFSELFDSIFIHWGQSASKDNYVGANTVFRKDKVDHINQMTLDDKEDLYGRDQTRKVSSEHRGILYGAKVPATIKNEGFRTEPKEYSKLAFFEQAQPASTETAAQITVRYSKQSDWEDTVWKYNTEDEKYHTDLFDCDFSRDNILVLYDDTEYITKENYHGTGASVTYCDYLFKGGKAQLFTKGSVKELQWQRKAGKLMLIDPDVTMDDVNAKVAEIMEADPKKKIKKATREALEAMDVVVADIPMKDKELEEALAQFEASKEAGEVEEDAEYEPEKYVVQRLNKGKTWIGWISNNNGGSVKVKAGDYTLEMPVKEVPAEEGAEGETTEGTDAAAAESEDKN